MSNNTYEMDSEEYILFPNLYSFRYSHTFCNNADRSIELFNEMENLCYFINQIVLMCF